MTHPAAPGPPARRTLPTLALAAVLLPFAGRALAQDRPAAVGEDSGGDAGGDSGTSGTGQPKSTAGKGGGQTYSPLNPAPLTGSISTGRPSFGTGTTAVPAGRLQVESGYTYTSDSADKTQTFPNLLLRYGLNASVEARLATTGYVQSDTGEDGLTGVRLGAKIEVLHQDVDGLSLAVQPSILLPGGDVPGGGNHLDPLVQVAASYSVSDDVGLLANVSGAAVTAGSGEQRFQYATSILASYAPLDRLGLFAEYYAIYSDQAADAQFADVGATYLLTDNVQVDVVVGAGLSADASDYFVGAGYSFRF